METHESIIDDLQALGVKLDEVMILAPTYRQLSDLRDALKWLREQRKQIPVVIPARR